MLALAGLTVAVILTDLSVPDIFASVLAFIPTGWGILSVSSLSLSSDAIVLLFYLSAVGLHAYNIISLKFESFLVICFFVYQTYIAFTHKVVGTLRSRLLFMPMCLVEEYKYKLFFGIHLVALAFRVTSFLKDKKKARSLGLIV